MKLCLTLRLFLTFSRVSLSLLSIAHWDGPKSECGFMIAELRFTTRKNVPWTYLEGEDSWFHGYTKPKEINNRGCKSSSWRFTFKAVSYKMIENHEPASSTASQWNKSPLGSGSIHHFIHISSKLIAILPGPTSVLRQQRIHFQEVWG